MGLSLSPVKIAVYTVSALVSIFIFARLLQTTDTTTDVAAKLPFFGKQSKLSKLAHPIQNNTLGFEKIFVLNLPERTDKRDAMSLAAALTNISVEYIDGVRGDEVVNKSLPYGQEERKMPEPMLGSWRAHMNAIRTIVEEGYSSVLILEDDADWDVRIKNQLTDFAAGARWLQNQDPKVVSHSPYGDDWDMLWLGHCHDSIDETDTRTFLIEGDMSAPAWDHLNVHQKDKDWLKTWPDHTRVIHKASSPICTFAYALSQKGARKVLWSLSVYRLKGLFDNAISWWCKDKEQGASCYNAHPSYFMPHQSRGGKGKNSDNNPNVGPKDIPETRGIQWSARMNTMLLLTGNTNYQDAYPDPPKEEKKEGQ